MKNLQLNRIAAETRAMLDSSEAAILLFDNNEQILTRNSAAIARFGGAQKLDDVFTMLGISQVAIEAIRAVLGDNEISLLANEGNFATTAHYQKRQYHLTWAPVLIEHSISRITLTASDITEAILAREEASAAGQKAQLLMLLATLSPPQRDRLLSDILAFTTAIKGPDQSLAKRRAHTLKGNALGLGFNEFGEMLHRWESSQIDAESVLQSALMISKLSREVFGDSRGRIIDRQEALVAIEEGRSETLLRTAFYPSIAEIIEQNPSYQAAGRLAKKLGKETPAFEVCGGDLRLRPHIAESLSTVLTHTIRNALDHGLETALIRHQRKKRNHGTIFVTGNQSDEGLVVHLRDDGGGLDLPKLREKAGDSTLDDETAAAKIFQAGVSTKNEVTDISGRGVGLDAALAAAQAIGGTISVNLGAALPNGYRSFSLVVHLPLDKPYLVEEGAS